MTDKPKVSVSDGFTLIPNRAIADPTLNASDVYVLACVYYLTQMGSSIRQEEIGRMTGLSRPTIRKAVDALNDGGYVVRIGKTKLEPDENGKKFSMEKIFPEEERTKEEEYKHILNVYNNNSNINNTNSLSNIKDIQYNFDIRVPIENKDYPISPCAREDVANILTEPEETPRRWTCKDVIGYLNEKTGRKYNYRSRENRKHIDARVAEGYSDEDFRRVIDYKTKEWKGTRMEKYLRPETLFCSKFDRYLNDAARDEEAKADDPLAEVFG